MIRNNIIRETKHFIKFFYSGRCGFNAFGVILFTPIIFAFIIPFCLLGLVVGKWES